MISQLKDQDQEVMGEVVRFLESVMREYGMTKLVFELEPEGVLLEGFNNKHTFH